ncbi:MAG: hypothetical protein GY863_06155, partial [bacterium]|nr:hypothetical protein [bacterium]
MEIAFSVEGTELAIEKFEDDKTKKAAYDFKAKVENELKDFKCPEHGEEPKVIFNMTQPDVESINAIEVFGCCDVFKMSV